ncbi:hypothetical protein TeGR_g7697 [Tetraparma gracilis]|uniref:RING-type domain-containing protein n=1 Tax=Tetraparma gracilis TaxID=2962635 RepID=A0ABQ6MND2_9STRA|nr:hypothetical protein TeGR_g7697 [Tetraparma gracilis]
MTQEDMDEGRLCYCGSSSAGCGANIHVRCLRMYGTHLVSEKKKVLCPLCRAPWGDLPEEGGKAAKPGSAPGSASGKSEQRMARFSHAMPVVKCKACKLPCRSSFARCTACVPPHDLCRRCFSTPHSSPAGVPPHDPSHVFVYGDATSYPTVWSAAIPPVDRTALYANLQGRELSENDYSLLLSLDGAPPPVQRHLVQAFPKVDKATLPSDATCVVCQSPVANDPEIRRFPCRGNCAVHGSCALSLLIEHASSEQGVASAVCPGCGGEDGRLFPALQRRPKRKQQQQPPQQQQQQPADGQPAAAPLQGGLMLTGSMLATGSIGAPADAPAAVQPARVAGRPPLGASAIRRSESAPTSLDGLSLTGGSLPLPSSGSSRGRPTQPVAGQRRGIHRSPVTITRARSPAPAPATNVDMGMAMTSTNYRASPSAAAERTSAAASFRSSFNQTARSSSRSRPSPSPSPDLGVLDFSSGITQNRIPPRGPGTLAKGRSNLARPLGAARSNGGGDENAPTSGGIRIRLPGAS